MDFLILVTLFFKGPIFLDLSQSNFTLIIIESLFKTRRFLIPSLKIYRIYSLSL